MTAQVTEEAEQGMHVEFFKALSVMGRDPAVVHENSNFSAVCFMVLWI